MRVLRHACKLSEKGRSDLRSQLSQAKKENAGLDSKTRHENKELKELITAALDLFQKGLSKFSSSNGALPVRALTFSTPVKSSSSGSFPLDCLNVSRGSDIGFHTDSLMSPPLNSPCKPPPSSCSTSSSKREKPLGLTEKEIKDIAERVRLDLRGEKLLSTNDKGKVVIGGGISISKETWDKAIKTQEKASFFIKRLGQAIYGHEGLKTRTIGSPKSKESGKTIATPAKVDAIIACYRGKLLAENVNPEAAEMASHQAKHISW